MRLDLRRIEALIPHRPPFLFLESACVVSPLDISAVARWPATHPVLAGHFPGFPLVPGVLVIEAAAQAAGVLVAATHDASPADHPRLGMLTGVRRASFHRPVYADSACTFSVRISQKLGHMLTATAQADLPGQGIAFKGEFSVAVVDRSQFRSPTPLHQPTP